MRDKRRKENNHHALQQRDAPLGGGRANTSRDNVRPVAQVLNSWHCGWGRGWHCCWSRGWRGGWVRSLHRGWGGGWNGGW